MIRLLILITLLVGTTVASRSQIAGYPDFELVESVPVETMLDNPGVRKTHEVWLEMINGARQSLEFEEFYISNQRNEPLDEILRAIVAAGKRGVKVRIIVDARMHRTYPEPADSLGRQENISSRVIDFGKLANGVQHSKYFIVDGEEIFLGSQNFDWRSLKHIHELGLKIRSREAVRPYADIFEFDWKLAGATDTSAAPLHPAAGTYVVPFVVREQSGDSVVFSPTASPKGYIPDSAWWDETNIVRLIDGAKKELMCQFLTWSPMVRDKSYYGVLNDALIRAAARGVNVRLIVSDWSKENPTAEYLKKLSKVPGIRICFSVIPEYSAGYIPFARVEHCKYIVADDASFWLGSSNAEKGYFYNLRNVGVVVRSEKLASLLKTIFLKDWNGPYVEKVDATKEYAPRKHDDK